MTTSRSADTPTATATSGDSLPEHRTRFDTEIVPDLDTLPLLWTLNDGRRLRRSGEPESVFQDAGGGTHTAYAMRRELPSVPGSRDPFKLDSQIWYRPPRGEAELAAHGPAFAPQIVALPAGTVLITFRLDGLKPPPVPPLPPIPPATGSWPDAGAYLRAREGGGASIGFAFRAQDGTWKRGYVARTEEINVRDNSEQETFAGRIYPAFETLGPPALGLDCHGVPWCFWANPLRRHTYFARWLGPTHGFSAPLEARGAYYALGETVALEAQMPLDASHLLGAAVAGGRVHLSPLPVPTPATSEQRHILFLDLLEVASLDGIEHRLGQVEKRSENPLVTPEDIALARGAPLRPLGAPKVWRHAPPSEAGQAGETEETAEAEEADVPSLRMELGPRGPMGGPATGFLESRDGLRWTLLPDAGITVDGEPAPPGSNADGSLCVTWLEDHAETNPDRRFKGALTRGNWIKNRRRWLVTSPDAIHWRTEAEMVGMHYLKEHGGPSFRDPASGEYVAVGRTSASAARAVGMLRSHDLIHWEGEEALLNVDDPYGAPPTLWRGQYVAGRILDPAGEPDSEQLYWGTAWPEHGLTLCLYGRYRWDARYEGALAVSRDGRNFMRIHRGESLLPCGDAGEWDSGTIFMDFGVAHPVAFPDQGILRLYYAGSTWRHGADPYRAPSAIGAADLREDGWAYLQPSRDATLPATVTTVPIQVDASTSHPSPAATLRVNAQGPIHWEILDELDRVLPSLPNAGRFRVRFFLESAQTRLYSFWFE